MAHQIRAAIAEIKKNAKYVTYYNKPCNPKIKLNILKTKDLFPDKKELGIRMDSLENVFNRHYKAYGLANYEDHLPFLAFTTTDSFEEFVKKIYFKDVRSVNASELKSIRKRYNYLKDFKKNGFYLGKQKFSKGGCSFNVNNRFVPKTWTTKDADKKINSKNWKKWVSTINGTLITEVIINCSCKGKTTKNVKSAVFEYRGGGSLIVKFGEREKVTINRINVMSFIHNKKSSSEILEKQVECCQKEDISYEEPLLENTTKEIGLVPSQSIGGFVGVGFQENFDEATFCIGAEYLYNISQIGNNPLIVGGTASYSNTSIFETTISGFAVGPTAQLFTPITPSNSVYITNGISAQYQFGNQDSYGFESSILGVNVLLNTGAHFPLNDKLGVSIMVPVLSFQSTTVKPKEGGESFSDSNLGLFLRNRSAIKVGVRLGF